LVVGFHLVISCWRKIGRAYSQLSAFSTDSSYALES
jgi:hypothetical protein